MDHASATGVPPMRPLFLEFPDDPAAWAVEDQFLLGPDILVAPVTELGARQRRVYLPAGAEWTDSETGRRYPGGAHVVIDAPLDRIPLLVRDDARLPLTVGWPGSPVPRASASAWPRSLNWGARHPIGPICVTPGR
ncbi:TIM-barrel domain-containing protein [Paractinoplanes globisporus]|uniref:TIM-barrel domain-containing protein n=1 Tax=Paractinoplanes globisporus TaxID=113565 RepID=A0ABW6W7Q0_9ACTN